MSMCSVFALACSVARHNPQAQDDPLLQPGPARLRTPTYKHLTFATKLAFSALSAIELKALHVCLRIPLGGTQPH